MQPAGRSASIECKDDDLFACLSPHVLSCEFISYGDTQNIKNIMKLRKFWQDLKTRFGQLSLKDKQLQTVLKQIFQKKHETFASGLKEGDTLEGWAKEMSRRIRAQGRHIMQAQSRTGKKSAEWADAVFSDDKHVGAMLAAGSRDGHENPRVEEEEEEEEAPQGLPAEEEAAEEEAAEEAPQDQPAEKAAEEAPQASRGGSRGGEQRIFPLCRLRPTTNSFTGFAANRTRHFGCRLQSQLVHGTTATVFLCSDLESNGSQTKRKQHFKVKLDNYFSTPINV